MDTVLLDPPLVALDKDAPVPYAGRKCKCKITNTLISAVQQTAHVLIECSMFIYTHSTQCFSHTHAQTEKTLTRMLQRCVQATVATSHPKTKTDDPPVLRTHCLSWRLNSIYHS